MITQTQTKITLDRQIFDFVLSTVLISTQPGSFSASGIGYPLNENDLADEMTAIGSLSPEDETASQVEPDEFEAIYQWFIS